MTGGATRGASATRRSADGSWSRLAVIPSTQVRANATSRTTESRVANWRS